MAATRALSLAPSLVPTTTITRSRAAPLALRRHLLPLPRRLSLCIAATRAQAAHRLQRALGCPARLRGALLLGARAPRFRISLDSRVIHAWMEWMTRSVSSLAGSSLSHSDEVISHHHAKFSGSAREQRKA
ncbi:hypothetical protein U9M48_026903 [Paspalum notatum var. saurae]|uniref:Uncharacterized protein n=1 Tax=Paspalum notatum var. saurae TaxID=547442 RepID=A0AAQ3TTQ8_PASNO